MKYPVSVSCRKGSFATVQRMAIGIGAYSTYGSRVRYLSLLVSGMFGPHQGQRGERARELRAPSCVDSRHESECGIGRSCGNRLAVSGYGLYDDRYYR